MTKSKRVFRLLMSLMVSLSLFVMGGLMMFGSEQTLQVADDSVNAAIEEPQLPTVIHYEYKITGTSRLKVDKISDGGKSLSGATSPADISAELDSQNEGRVTKITFGDPGETISVGTSYFKFSKGTYIIDGSVTGKLSVDNPIGESGFIIFEGNTDAYVLGTYTNTLRNWNSPLNYAHSLIVRTTGTVNLIGSFTTAIKVTGSGSTLNMSGGARIKSMYSGLFIAGSGTTLNIYNGKIEGDVSSDYEQMGNRGDDAIMFTGTANATFNLYNGTMKNVNANGSHSSFVFNMYDGETTVSMGGGTANIYGGKLSGNYGIVLSEGTANIYGGTQSSGGVAAIQISSGTLNYYDGEVIASGSASGIRNNSTGKAYIYGGTITANGNAIGVQNVATGEIGGAITSILGGTITAQSGSAVQNGRVVRKTDYSDNSTYYSYEGNGTLNIDGATITANKGIALHSVGTGKINIDESEGNTTLITSNNDSETGAVVVFESISESFIITSVTIENKAGGNLFYATPAAVESTATKRGQGIALDLRWDCDGTLEYTGQQQEVNVIFPNIVGEVFEAVYSSAGSYTNVATEIGSYSTMVSIADGDRDSFYYAVPINKRVFNYRIAQLIDNVWGCAGGFIYDGSAKVVTTTQSLPAGLTVAVVYRDLKGNVVAANQLINAGKYIATATLSGNGSENYGLRNSSYPFEIFPIEVTVVWSDYENLIYDGLIKYIKAAVQNMPGVEVSIRDGYKKNAGSYSAKATIDDTNYIVGEGSELKFSIAPKEVDVTWNGFETRVYDKEDSEVKAEVVSADIVSGDVVRAVVTGGAQVMAGTHTATAQLDNANYTVKEATKTKQYTIAPKEISITWNATTLVYNGSIQRPSASVAGVVSGDTANIVITGGAKTVGSNYTAEITGLTGAAAGNYKLPTEGLSTTFEITQKEIHITWVGKNDLVYNGNAKDVHVEHSGIVSSDNVELTVSGGNKTEIGNHTATVSIGGADAANYFIAEDKLSTVYTIAKGTPAAPRVEVDSVTKNSITIKTVENAQYSLDNENWQDSNEFTGLDAATSYTVYVRLKETDTALVSKVGQLSVITEEASKKNCGSISLSGGNLLPPLVILLALCTLLLIRKPLRKKDEIAQ